MRTALICAILLVLPAISGAVNTETHFGGVGIDGVRREDGRIVIRQMVAGGPAHRAGIRPGDILTHVDGQATAGSSFEAVVTKRLRGVAGTPVVLTLIRPGTDRPFKVTLIRRQLTLSPHKETTP